MQRISLNHAKQRLDQDNKARTERRTRLQAEEARYTVILHHPRKQLGLTINEYCLADTVHKLSGNRSIVPGWCYAAKDSLADGISITRRGIHKMINRLKEKGILQVHEGTGYLRTTEIWRETVEISKDKFFSQ